MNKEIEKIEKALKDLYSSTANQIENIKYELDKLKQPATETVRLWCAQDDYNICGKMFLRGDTLEFKDGRIFYPRISDYGSNYVTFDEYKRGNPTYEKWLFPLIHRPAKEGEWMLVTNSDDNRFNKYKNGDVVRAMERSLNNEGVSYLKNGQIIWDKEYDVIDGYHGEYETCPTCGKSMGEK